MKIQLNASIVLYKNNLEVLNKAIESFLANTLSGKLYLIDNSPTNTLQKLKNISNKIEYIFNNKNTGFGKAHNIAIEKSISENASYHLVLNPDVYFEANALDQLYDYMEKNDDIANISPKTFYPNGKLQYLCKLLPTPFDLIARRFLPNTKSLEKRNAKYEMRHFDYNQVLNVPSLSGSFMFLRVQHLKEIGLFDENIFMYLEDIDLNRRLHEKYKTIFFPQVSITHVHAKESYIKPKLLFIHIKSAIYYFNKYGWFHDIFRKEKNQEALAQISYLQKTK